ncbi:Uncharacterised protein [Oligella urethralis]|uniref:hypothetical protein n=1 Tax=Oligella urethralis TaxID=90245 RepID=UPI000E0608A2|nr:hypothetical protein [Oligella urethralis]SUA63358.1 Uncharacterised protein [Oligella urethralis]
MTNTTFDFVPTTNNNANGNANWERAVGFLNLRIQGKTVGAIPLKASNIVQRSLFEYLTDNPDADLMSVIEVDFKSATPTAVEFDF